MKIEARPWTPQDLIDDLQEIINEESKEYLNTRRTTLEMALAYLKEYFARPSWIPVSERLPGIFEPVIVWTKLQEIGEAHYNGKQFRWIDDEGDYNYAYVTHWMPLPEPPKEE